MKKLFFTGLIIILLGITGCQERESRVEQAVIERISQMPYHPEPYKMLDWNEKAVNFDQIIFNLHPESGKALIWFDDSQRNFPQTTFGLYTVIGDVRQGKDKNNGEFHEAINSLGALMSAGLNGIDKTDQNGYNYVMMVQNYFNSGTGWNIMMNNTCPEVALLGGGYGRDWWYDVFPNVLYYAVCDLFPGVERADSLQRIIAEQFCSADSVLRGNYDYSFFNYAEMKGERNHIPYQQDAAAAHAWVLYNAYMKFNDPRYLDAAISATAALEALPESRFYEVLLPFGAYMAARLNAEQGMEFDVEKMLNRTFDGCTAEDGRTGWGVINGRWGSFDVSGMVGNIIQDGGYGFLMNTFDLAWPLVPMVRYDPRFAEAVGHWMLNAANTARLFYPYEIPDSNQWLPEKKAITKNVIAYEGLKKVDAYDKKDLQGVSPVALGDGPNWIAGQPEESMFSVYGSAHVGIFGSIIRETNVEQILQLNCLATDFYHTEAFPTYLYYNPYEEEKSVEFISGNGEVDIYDAVSHRVIADKIVEGSFIIPGRTAVLAVILPSGTELQRKGNRIMAGDVVVAYR